MESVILELTAGVKHTLVVYLSRDDVALFVPVEGRGSFERQVVGLSRPACEDDFLLGRPNQVGDVLPRFLTCLLRLPAEAM